MKKYLIPFLVLLTSFPFGTEAQKLEDIFNIFNKGVEIARKAEVVNVAEIAKYIEIVAVLVSSEDNLECWLNRTVNEQIVGNNRIATSPRLTALGEEMASRSERPYLPQGLTYHFYIIEGNYYNAFAVPGGTIYVTRALYETLDDDEMAFVLGHEIGHICKKHMIIQIKRDNAFIAIKDIGLKLINPRADVAQLIDAIAITTYKTVQAGYSREWEKAVDNYGLMLSYECGYDPDASISALKKIADASGTWYACCFLWDTHPTMIDRVQLLNTSILAYNLRKTESLPEVEQPLLADATTEEAQSREPAQEEILMNTEPVAEQPVLVDVTTDIEMPAEDESSDNGGFSSGQYAEPPAYVNAMAESGKSGVVSSSEPPSTIDSYETEHLRLPDNFTEYDISTIEDPTMDIILKNDGSYIRSDIIDFTETEIRYRMVDQPNGPVRDEPFNNILMILYKNGQRALFNSNYIPDMPQVDIVYRKDGTQIVGIVFEITTDTIWYKKFEAPKGPAINLAVDDVYMILYADGTKRTFE